MLTNAHTQRLVIEDAPNGQRAAGVEVRFDGAGVLNFNASREGILSAGSIGSPQILQVSGIGPGQLLRSKGIKVIHDLPGVGENLQDHLQVRSVYKVENTVTLNQRANSLFGKIMMGLQYVVFKTGPLTMPPSQLGAFAKSDPNQPSPNIEWHVQPLSLDKFGEPLHRLSLIHI